MPGSADSLLLVSRKYWRPEGTARLKRSAGAPHTSGQSKAGPGNTAMPQVKRGPANENCLNEIVRKTGVSGAGHDTRAN